MTLRSAIVLLLASSLTALAGAIMAPALPTIEEHFAGTANVKLLTRMIIALPALGVVLSAPIAGRLADRWGRRRLMIAGMALYGASGTTGVWLSNLPAILAGRFVLGVAVAAIMISATAIIADLTTGAARSRFMGWQVAAMSFGGMIYLISGGVLSDLGWQWPFAIYGISVLMIPGVLLSIAPDLPQAENRRLTGPLPPTLKIIYFAAFMGMLLFYLTPLQLPFLLREGFDIGGTRTGLALSLITLSITFGSLLFPTLRSRLGSPRVFVLTFLVMAPGMALIGWASSWPFILGGAVVMGAASGWLMPNQNVWISELVPDAQRGRALGNLTTAIFLGQFTSPLLMEPAIRTGASPGQLFVLGAGLSVIVALVLYSLLFRR